MAYVITQPCIGVKDASCVEVGAPDDVYEELTRRFSAEEIVALTLEVVAINGWNRLAVGFRSPVGDYVSRRGAEAASRR